MSDLLYFALSSGYGTPNTTTAPYGGWGFGLTREAANDTNVLFAPYYALEMWSQAIPAGEPDVYTNSSAPAVIESYGARDGTNLSVVLVNRDSVPVMVNASLASGNYTLGSVATLDQRSYSESYVPSENTTTLRGPGIATRHPANATPFEINGYGVAVASFVPPQVNGSGGEGRRTAPATRAAAATILVEATPRGAAETPRVEAIQREAAIPPGEATRPVGVGTQPAAGTPREAATPPEEAIRPVGAGTLPGSGNITGGGNSSEGGKHNSTGIGGPGGPAGVVVVERTIPMEVSEPAASPRPRFPISFP